MRLLLIEDEAHSLESLELQCRSISENFEIVKTQDLDSGADLILKEEPDVILIDVEFPGGRLSFDMLNQLPKIDAQLIFTTGHDKYAFRAFRSRALDYLLKPIDLEELKSALVRAQEKIDQKRRPDPQYLQLLSTGLKSKISLPLAHGKQFISIEDIVRFEADGSYSKVFLSDSPPVLVTRRLALIEDALKLKGFLRIHRKHLVNLMMVTKYQKIDGGIVEMSDGNKLPVSRNLKGQFVSLLESLITQV
ncbi:response regulator transcription factor [bacterium SCSIO 12741]|nr:response regulator transcription factor [bacterium SCSIO 12741]